MSGEIIGGPCIRGCGDVAGHPGMCLVNEREGVVSEYLEFVETGDTGKTKIFKVRSRSSHKWLGFVRWHAPWRQYTFMPYAVTVWNTDCLADIITFINGLMYARKHGQAEAKALLAFKATL